MLVSLSRLNNMSSQCEHGVFHCVAAPDAVVFTVSLWSPAVRQLELLESRKKQYIKAALQAKQKNDVEQAKALYRTAKSLDPMIQAVHSGGAVDVSTVSALIYLAFEMTYLQVMSPQVPSPPGDEDEDFILVHHSDVQLSDKAEQVYAQLTKMVREQYEVRLQDQDGTSCPNKTCPVFFSRLPSNRVHFLKHGRSVRQSGRSLTTRLRSVPAEM